MADRIRNRHLFIFDVAAVIVASYLSFVFRLETISLDGHWGTWGFFTLSALPVYLLIYGTMGVYRRYWQIASIDELLLLCKSTTLGFVLTAAISFLCRALAVPGFAALPRSIPFIFFLLSLAFAAGLRFALRVLTSRRHLAAYHANGSAIRVLIMGAGQAGSMILKEILGNPQLGLKVVGFLDDDPTKRHLAIHGVPVLGSRHDLRRVLKTNPAEELIIAMPGVHGKVVRQLVEVCKKIGLETKIMPGIYELLGGTVSVTQLRQVQIEDLLRREPVETDLSPVRELIRGKKVLVTGGGGSIGSELCRQLLDLDPAELLVLGHGENQIFEVHNELSQRLLLKRPALAEAVAEGDGARRPALTPLVRTCRVIPLIADIRAANRLRHIFQKYRPEIVFHAAAHKHVPLMEMNPAEAVFNNVMGTRTLLEAAMAAGVERFIMISSDKAINPTSIMGASKRMAEYLVYQAAGSQKKPYCTVRFGNVLGSRGSVLHIFKQQIAQGGPVTVTHPEMRRYFMTIPEAVQLVLQAATMGKGGEVFVLDMGEPVKITDLAQDMIRLSGLKVGQDLDIVFTGLRPGEKLYEELFAAGEVRRRTDHDKIFSAENGAGQVFLKLDEALSRLEKSIKRNDEAGILQILQKLVPGFRPDKFMEETRGDDRLEVLNPNSMAM